MADTRAFPLLPVLLVVLVIAGSGVGLGYLYEHNNPRAPSALWTVSVGDNVTVNYIGTFGSGPQTGRVFDTSIYSVAINNVSYPKSLEFSYRGNKSAYTPLGVSVGPNIPSSGYTIDGTSFGGVVPGFWQGLLGLPIGKTKTISFPPSLGYGAQNPSCLVTKPLTFTVPVVESMTKSQFIYAYLGVNATAGTEFKDPTYGWLDLVLSVNASAVVVENLPPVGWSVPSGNWPVVVTNISASNITLVNQLTPTQAGLVLGHGSGSGVCGSTKYIVSAVNPSLGTYTQDYNMEVEGQTLTFTVTVVASF